MLKALLLLLSAGKLAKLAASGGTMIVSVVAYAFFFGWWYAVGFVAMIFVHEMGHYLAAKWRGLDVGLPTFIPFIGAWIQMKKLPHDVETEAFVGMGGPLLGTIGALGCYFVARSYDSALLLAVSYAGFFINLFNMIPLSPFDGGRMTAILSPRIWFAGVPVLVGLFLWKPSPMLVLMAILAAPALWKAWKYDASAPENAAYYGVKLEVKVEYTAYYLILLAFLAVMTYEVHALLPKRGAF